MISQKSSWAPRHSFLMKLLALCILVSATVCWRAASAEEQPPAQLKPEALNPVKPEPKQTPAELLDQAVAGMRSARAQIESGKAGQETQQLQQQAVDNLTKLIKLLKNQPPPQQQQPPQNPPQQHPPQRQPEQPQQQTKEQQKQQQTPGGQPSDGKSSSERERSPEKHKLDAAAREQLLRDIWGHLPEAIRNQLGNSFSEDYLPKYAAEVRKYYEELAKRRQSRRQP